MSLQYTSMATSSDQVTYWPSVCGNDSIYDAFWSNGFTINTPTPDLTECFQQTALTWTVCGTLWVMCLGYVPYLRSCKLVHPWGSISRLNLLQTIVISILVALNICNVCYYLSLASDGQLDTRPTTADYCQSLVQIVTFILATVLTHWAFKKGQHNPGVLFVFWLLQLLAGIIPFRSKILRQQNEGYIEDLFLFITFYAQFALILVQFVLTLFSDVAALSPSYRPRQHRQGQEPELEPLITSDSPEVEPLIPSDCPEDVPAGKNPCPEMSASFLSRALFLWFFGKLMTGYKRTLSYEDDIWDTQPDNSSQVIVPRFLKAWNREFRRKTRPERKPNPIENELANDVATKSKYGGMDSSVPTSNDAKPTSNKTEHSFVYKSSVPSAKPSGRRKKPSLVKALAKTLGASYIPLGLYMLGMDVFSLANPLILSQLIAFLQDQSADSYKWQGYIMAVSMFVMSVLSMNCFCHYFNGGYKAGMRSRTALTAAIYRKALNLSNAVRKTTTVGEIVNLMSVDVEKVVQCFLGLHFLWSAPVMVLASLYLQYLVIGPACFAGLFVVFVIVPINTAVLAKKIRTLQKEQMILKDSRIKLMNQILNGMKVLKLYAWEPHFRDVVLRIRDKELKNLRTASIFSAATFSLWFLSPFLVALLDFMVFTLTNPDRPLDSQMAFTMISLIQAQNFQFSMVPQVILWIVQANVSLARIQKFLLEDELNDSNVESDLNEEAVVKIEDGTFSWGEADRITLKSISFSVPQGGLVGIVGNVGSGKSSIISAILGEMEKHQGQVVVNGSIAYVPQQAWIQNMTLRDNILFSKPLDQAQYKEILSSCALEPDLETLPGGDMTEIGERGINLSGGQKQRVSLGRAVYQDTDIYLLDDPLSAVDAHVGKHIFKHVIGPEGLLKNKTRLLVTHSITHLSKMDLIIVMDDGHISEIGAYDELLSHKGAFAEFIATYLVELVDTISDPEDLEEIAKLQKLAIIAELEKSHKSDQDSLSLSGTKRSLRRKGSVRSGQKSRGSSETVTTRQREELQKQLKEQYKLIKEESLAEGTVGLSVLKAYAKAATMTLTSLALCFFVLYVASMVGTNLWLSEWTNDAMLNATWQEVPSPNMRLAGYGGLGACQVVASFCMSLAVVNGAVSASNRLHLGIMNKIVQCPMSFFDTTPLGRILNRFSKDVDIMDTNIQQYFLNLFMVGGPLLSVFIIIIYTTPIFLSAFIPLTIIFALMQRFYVHCSRQIKRIDAVKKSPIYAFFSETLNGTSSIRAYNQMPRFTNQSDNLVDDSQKVWFEVFTSNRWVNVWAEIIGDFVILFTGLFAVMQKGSLDPSLISMALTFTLQVSFNLVFTVRNTCDLETYIVSVERIKEYADLPPEAPWEIPERRPDEDWPAEGAVEFQGYSVRYREALDLVLKDISCRILPGEKVGVVGRTGAGKTSMTLGLFRLLEAAGGKIIIDGQDINQIGVHDLRNKLTIIPQDPVLFSGTLRFNLDPATSHTDQDVWKSLEQSHLKDFVKTLPEHLSYEVGENGENLSVGQRQLICLARALLRKTKILVLDEATAAVDMETDELIQATIRSEFKECTVMTIAHRLNTILDYDRVIVMADGKIVEIDSPNALQENKDSLFYSMARDAGIM